MMKITKRIVSAALVYVGLVLILLGLFSSAYLSSPGHTAPGDSCIHQMSKLLNEILPERLNFTVKGSSYTRLNNLTIINKWISIESCQYNGLSPSVYVDELYPMDNRNGKVAILLHDYGSDHYSLYNLANYLAEKGFSVLIPDLPGHGHSKYPYDNSLRIDSLSPRDSFWIHSLCLIKILVDFAHRVMKSNDVYVIGVALGGTLALMSGGLVEGINTTISLGLLGDYKFSFAKASLVNYIYRDTRLPLCIDSFKYLTNNDVKRIVVIGSNDEYIYYESLGLLAEKSIVVLVELNTDHRSFMKDWRSVIGELIESNISLSGSSVYLLRPLIPGAPWYSSQENPGFTLIPYIESYAAKIGKTGLYRIRDVRVSASPILPIALGSILVLLGVFPFIDILRRESFSIIDYSYVFLLFLVITTPFIPSIWAPGRFNIGIMELTDRLSHLLPVISQLIFLFIIVEPLFFIYILHGGGRGSFYVYVSYPIFIVMMIYSFVLIMGYRYGNMFPVYPTWSLIIIVLLLVVDYLFTAESPHEESSSSQ